MRARDRAWCRAAALLTALAFTACARPGAQRIIGPDGSQMVHVHCGADQGTCFRLAGELCHSGYELQPVLAGSEGNFLVRCRAPKPAASAVASCPSAAPAPVAASPSRDAWPPSNEPWPVAYPWSPPETSATVQSAPATRPAPVEIDLGY